jgi:hypothetical protein
MIFFTDMYHLLKTYKGNTKYPEQEVGTHFFSLLFRKGQTIETFKEDIKVQLILQKNIIFN